MARMGAPGRSASSVVVLALFTACIASAVACSSESTSQPSSTSSSSGAGGTPGTPGTSGTAGAKNFTLKGKTK